MSTTHQLDFADIFGFQVARGPREEVVEWLLGGAERQHPVHVLTLNPEMVTNEHGLGEAGRAVRAADFCVADGVGIAWGAVLLTGREVQHYPGIDLALDLLSRLAQRGGSVYLLGSRPGVAERAGRRLTQQLQGLKIAGYRDGYFAVQEEAVVVANISETAPDLLLVGMGSPRQEGFIAAHKHELGVPLLIGVGGALDVLAGDIPRAPRLVRMLGLEWLFRTLQDFARLKRLSCLPRFLWLLVNEKMRRVS